MIPFKNTFRAVFLVLIFLSPGISAKANSAQPGIWNAGGKVYTMMYPEDSATFKKVQMQQEKIYIQLYKGYAVVKGWYKFKNTTSEKLKFKMGYPVNGIYSGGEVYLNQIEMDSLSSFKIFAQQKPLEIIRQPIRNEDGELQLDDDGTMRTLSENWFVWQMDFEPNQTQEVEVYFIVETNNAGISKGYNQEKHNAFIYLLESGSVWKNPIERGDFYVQLIDGLTEKEVHGFSDGFGMKYNENQQIFWGNRINLSPTKKDNLVFTYWKKKEKFDYQSVLAKTEDLFQKIDTFSKTNFEQLSFVLAEAKDPYEVETTFWGNFPALLTIFVIFAPFIIGGFLLLILIWTITKWVRLQKRKKGKL